MSDKSSRFLLQHVRKYRARGRDATEPRPGSTDGERDGHRQVVAGMLEEVKAAADADEEVDPAHADFVRCEEAGGARLSLAESGETPDW